MLKIALACMLCGSAVLSATPANILGITPTRVILGYTAPDLLPCTISVLDPYGNLIHDVDSSLFASANSDSRSIVSFSVKRIVIIGKRSAELALDGVTKPSRALEAGATHTYTITCTSPVTFTGSFRTAQPALGNTYNDPLPVDPNNPGQYAWPTISWTNQQQNLIDPQTGFLMRRLDTPRTSYVAQGFNQAFVSASSGGLGTCGTGWTNCSNAIADDAAVAAYSGTNQATLALEMGQYFGGKGAVHGTLNLSSNVFNALLNAWSTSAGVSIQVCLSVQGPLACTSDWITIALPQCASSCTGVGPNRFNLISGTPLPMFADWFAAEGGQSTIDTVNFVQHKGTVNRVNNAVSIVGGTFSDSFNTAWTAAGGATITINGTNRPISSVNSDQGITTTGASGSDTSVAYVASNTFLLIRAATSSSTTFNVQYGNYYYEIADPVQIEAGGDEDAIGNCAPLQVAGPGGELGWHCNFSQILYWVGATTFTSSRLGYAAVPSHAGPPSWNGACLTTFWDSTNANLLYCPVSSGTHTLLLQLAYTGSNVDIGDLQELQSLTACGPSPCWTITNLTGPGSELDTQMASFAGSTWNIFPGPFPVTSISLIGRTGLNNSLMFLVRTPANNDTLAWLVKFNLNTSLVDGMVSTWGHPPLSWGGSHGALDYNNPQFADMEHHFFDGTYTTGASDIQGNGPYYALVTSGAISGTPSTCPGQPGGNILKNWPTGSHCRTITLDGAPGDPSPSYYGTLYCPSSTTGCGTTITTSGSTVTGVGGTAWTALMTGQQMLVSSTYCTFTFVSATSGTCPGVPSVTGANYKLYTESVNSGKTGNPAFAYLQDVIPGDVICLSPAGVQCTDLYGGANDFNRVLINSSNTLTLQVGWDGTGSTSPVVSQSSGAWATPMPGSCQFGPTYPCIQARAVWDFINDPHGTNPVGATIIANPNDVGCCHGSYQGLSVNLAYAPQCPTVDGDSNWCHAASGATMPGLLTSPPAYIVSYNPSWHGLRGFGFTDSVDVHPGHTQYIATDQENSWVGEARPMLGDQVGGLTGSSSSHGTNTTGTLWKFTAAQTNRLRPRLFPTMAFAGSRPLLDVSGPASVIGGTSGDNFKYCIALLVNECVSGSSVGDLYVNAPYVSTPYCYYNVPGADDPGWEVEDICVGDMGAHTMAATQVSVRQADPDGRFSRRVTHALGRYHRTNIFWNVKMFPDGKAMAVISPWLGGLRTSFLVVKLPPFPAPDAINRGDYIPIPVSVATAISGANNAVIQFGYDTSFRCTTRGEACLSNSTSAAFNATTPFSWASEAPAGASCTTGCKIYIPAISQRILYYSVVIRNSSNAVLQTGPTQVLAVP